MKLPVAERRGRTDDAETVLRVGIVEIGVRRSELRFVQKIKRFGAELDFRRIGKVEVFQQTEIQLRKQEKYNAELELKYK